MRRNYPWFRALDKPETLTTKPTAVKTLLNRCTGQRNRWMSKSGLRQKRKWPFAPFVGGRPKRRQIDRLVFRTSETEIAKFYARGTFRRANRRRPRPVRNRKTQSLSPQTRRTSTYIDGRNRANFTGTFPSANRPDFQPPFSLVRKYRSRIRENAPTGRSVISWTGPDRQRKTKSETELPIGRLNNGTADYAGLIFLKRVRINFNEFR